MGIFALTILLLVQGPLELIKEAQNLKSAGKYQESLELYLSALKEKMHPKKKYEILIELADIEMEYLEKYDDALKHLLVAKSLFSEDAYFQDKVFYRLGLLYEKMGDFVNAAKSYETIVTKFRKSSFWKDASSAIERCFAKNIKEYVAVVDNEGITTMEFENYLQNMPPFARPKPDDIEGRKRILQQLVEEKVLSKEAEEKELFLDPEFRQKLADFRKRALIGILFLREVRDKLVIPENEKRAYYEENKEKLYKIPGKYDIRRIEVKEKDKALELFELLKKGAKFDSLAKEHSIAPEAQKGGVVQNFMEQGKPDEIADALKKMKEGEIKGPISIKSTNTYVIIQLIKKYPASIRKYEEVQSGIENQLKQQKEREEWEKFKQKVLEKHKVEILLGK